MKWKIAAAAGGLALVVLLIAFALKADLITPPPAAATGPLKIVAFQNGEQLEILGVSVGERVLEDRPAKGLFKYFVREKGGSGYFQGGNGKGLKVASEREDGRAVRFRAHADSTGAMLMEIRLKESNGTPAKLTTYMVGRNSVMQDRRMGGTDRPTSFKPTNDSVGEMSAAMDRAGLRLLVQQRDPQSGWIDLTGPFLFNEAWTDRYLMVLTAWQRSLPTLDFRAILADGQVTEFSLPNPDFRKSPAPGKLLTFPVVHNAADYTLTLRKVERFSTAGDHPFAAVEMDLHYKGSPVPGLKAGPINFNEGALQAEDEWGNVLSLRRETIHKKTSFGAFLPADSRRMTLNLRVERTDNYPRIEHAGFTVLEGVVSADGSEVDFKPGPDAALFGIRKMPACKIKPTTYPPGTKDWKELQYEISGENGRKELETIQRRIADIGQWKFSLFSGESTESAGYSGAGLGGGCGTGADGRFNFQMGFTWHFPPEILLPDAKIRVGVHGPLKSDDLRFDLELPALVQPR